MKTSLVVLALAAQLAFSQSTKKALTVTSLAGLTSSWPGEGGCANVLDNRSASSRRNVYHSLWAVGTGTWTAKLQYSNVACTGPWTDYASTASINQSSSPAIAFANDAYSAPAEFIKVVLTGSVTVTYVGQSQLPLSPATGSPTFPCTVAQGCTGISAWTPQYSVLQAGPAGDTEIGPVHLDQAAAVTGALPKANETMPAWSDVTGTKQGNTNVPHMAGANSGVAGAGLCNDANGNTTTTGCSTGNPTSSSYDFAAMTCSAAGSCVAGGVSGMSLGIGVNILSFQIVPLGVSGAHTVAANLPHLLYVSGGTGTDEACVIIGGTGTPLQVNGQIIITCAHTHSGGWTIKSNTTGVQEDIYVAGSTGRVQLPCSTVDLWGNTGTLAALTVPDGYSTSVRGCGMRNTVFRTHGTTGDWVTYDYVSAGGNVDAADFEILDASSTSHTTGSMLKIRYRSDGKVENIKASYCYDCVVAEGDNRVRFSDLYLSPNGGHYGLWITCAGVANPTCTSQLDLSKVHVLGFIGTHGIHIQDTTTGVNISQAFIENGGATPSTALNTAIYLQGTSTGPLNEITIQDSILDSHTYCLSAAGNGASYNNNSIQVIGNHIACSGDGILFGNYVQNLQIQQNYIGVAGGISGSNASDRAIFGNANNARRVTISGNTMDSDGDYCVVSGGSSVSDMSLTNNTCGQNSTPNTASFYTPLAINNLTLTGNIFGYTPTAWNASAYGTGVLASNNVGIDTVVPAITAASTTAFPVNPSFTLTGATAVSAVTVPLAAGAKYTFVATNAAPGTWTVGATIGNTFTPSQNIPVSCIWDGTKIWCKP